MDLNSLVDDNQSIKIVPSIEDSLRKNGFDTDLDCEIMTWFFSLKKTWLTWKKSATVESQIVKFLQSSPEPYSVALSLTIKCEEYKDSKPKSLPYYIIETLNKLTPNNGWSPDERLKVPAFQVAIQQRNQHFLSLVVRTYQLLSIKSKVLPVVKEMIKQGNYKQATQTISAMDLYNDIPVEDVLFPLVLQDKTGMVDEYLTQSPTLVTPFLLFLDQMLDKNFKTREFVQNYIESNTITDIKYDKLHYKPLGKLVARLCNKFKLPINTCKNLSKNRTSGGLRYLIHQKYMEKTVSSAVWEDLVKDALDQNSDTVFDFIDLLADYDKKEALKWVEYLKLPESQYPNVLKTVNTEHSVREEECWDEDPTHSQQFYKLSLKNDRIIIVDTSEKFYDMTSCLKSYSLIGVDCEWKPSFGATSSQVALIQISVIDTVYLIDTLVLNTREYTSFWYTLYKTILDNAEIIKIGFGLEQDLKEIKATVIGLSSIKIKGEGLLDLSQLWKNLIDMGMYLPYHADGAGASLSNLVKSCFNLPLQKSEQCSNWELRPLRKSQIDYAALDSYVLIEIYNFLQNICQNQKINFEEICNDIMLDVKQKIPKKSKISDRLVESFSNEVIPKTPVIKIKFLIDAKLSFLLSHLRYLGIDSIVMSTSMLWHDVINLAASEDRYILLSKLKLSPTPNFPQSSILELSSGEIKDHLKKNYKSFQY